MVAKWRVDATCGLMVQQVLVADLEDYIKGSLTVYGHSNLFRKEEGGHNYVVQAMAKTGRHN
jgi:hypothetical protein